MLRRPPAGRGVLGMSAGRPERALRCPEAQRSAELLPRKMKSAYLSLTCQIDIFEKTCLSPFKVQPLADNGNAEEFPTVKKFRGWSSIYDFHQHKQRRAAGLVARLFALLDPFNDMTAAAAVSKPGKRLFGKRGGRKGGKGDDGRWRGGRRVGKCRPLAAPSKRHGISSGNCECAIAGRSKS